MTVFRWVDIVRAIGAAAADRETVAPALITAWYPEHVPPYGTPSEAGWAPCLKATLPGERGIVWEPPGKGGRGIVGVLDFGEPTSVVHKTFRYAGWSELTLLDPPIDPDAIDAEIRPLFSFQGTVRGIPLEVRSRVHSLLPSVPVRIPPPAHARERRTMDKRPWRRAHGRWEKEMEIELHIARRKRAWQRLFFREAPQRQRGINPKDRPDLYAPGVVAEIKLRASANDVDQIERYLRALGADEPRSPKWTGVHRDRSRFLVYGLGDACKR